MRKQRQRFRIIGGVRWRRDDLIADQIIGEACAKRSRIAEVMHLNGGRAQCQNIGRRAFGVPFAIDQNIDAIAPNRLGDARWIPRRRIDEAIECPHEALAHRTRVIGPDRIPEYFKAPPVVMREKSGRQERGCVRVEIGGEITDSQP